MNPAEQYRDDLSRVSDAQLRAMMVSSRRVGRGPSHMIAALAATQWALDQECRRRRVFA
jgi:hypothetical protein